MIAGLIRRLTGRDYVIASGDIGYLLSKGAIPFLRGALWSMGRLRAPRSLLLGPHIQFIQPARLFNGQGVSIGGFSYIDCSADGGIVLGSGVTIRERAWIQGRSGLNARAARLKVGDRSYIGPNAVIGLGGPVTIGEGVQIGAGLTITAEAHEGDADGSFVTGHVSRTGVTIGDNCWLGNNVSLLDGVELGEGCIIGAGAVVTRSVQSYSVAAGVPARIIRKIR
ncbi:acyltransferase [Sphingomonas sp. Leaf17]|uniref:acyltransferase n=1 Tax=Sphingomonas sp. Leaf17 TaxID=1735683 RepID=UPI000AB70AA7|nr:acyltransferase [Sphingomonas sp. Leaf17]